MESISLTTCQLVKSPVAVEKLNHQEMAEKTLHWEALQTTFSVWVDIFYPPTFGCFEKNGVFQKLLPITLITWSLSRLNLPVPSECRGRGVRVSSTTFKIFSMLFIPRMFLHTCRGEIS
jgi:hypothetical protein